MYVDILSLQIYVAYDLLVITCQGSFSKELRRFVHPLHMLRLLALVPGIRGCHGNVAAPTPYFLIPFFNEYYVNILKEMQRDFRDKFFEAQILYL